MTKRGRKKAEKLKREAIHKLLDLALDINGVRVSQRKFTGDDPTAFFYMSGHVGKITVDVHPCGWRADDEREEGLSIDASIGGWPYENKCTLFEAARKLEKSKRELKG